MGLVTNAGWIDGNATDGLRRCLAEEFSDIYVFHLRGNARSSGALRQREGGNIFNQGSRAPIAISLLVKNANACRRGRIFFHDIGDYLSRDEKLKVVTDFGSINKLTQQNAWSQIAPDEHGDWLKQRAGGFDEFIKIGDKENKNTLSLFENYSGGVKTNRDAWCFNHSKAKVAENVEASIAFLNAEVDRYARAVKAGVVTEAKDFINRDPTRLNWDRTEVQGVERGRKVEFDSQSIVKSLYRPFSRQWLYFNRRFNNTIYQLPKLFPTAAAYNRVICVSAPGYISGFTALASELLPELCVAAMKGGTQCFPLYLYGDENNEDGTLFSAGRKGAGTPVRRDGITDAGLAHFTEAYPREKIGKEDIFYYVYGLLHSPEYRERFADNLSKELPRIPRVRTAADFWSFNKAGRHLAELHINYEKVPMYAGAKVSGGAKQSDYRVEKMRYGKSGKEKDLTTLLYNDKVSVTGIPLEAYDYVVNGKPALDWVVERQCVKTDKDSGIVNDANDWAVETMKNPKYPLELFLRVITVSLETMKIVRSLPALDILEPVKAAAE